MTHHRPTLLTSRFAYRLWLAAVVIFVLSLCAALMLGRAVPPKSGQQANAGSDAGAIDAPFVYAELPPPGAVHTPRAPFEPNGDYVLLAFGLQGLYQRSDAASLWNVDMPLPTLEAQLVRKAEDGGSPAVLTEGVRLYWEVDADTLVAGEPDAGPRSGEMRFEASRSSFSAVIPVLPKQKDGQANPYPVLRVSARNAQNDELLATVSSVLAVSPGFGCVLCHTDEASLLALHDRRKGTDLASLAKNEAVNCRMCHDGVSMNNGATEAGMNLSFSAAVHGRHAVYLQNRADPCLTCHIGLGVAKDAAPGSPQAMLLRDTHLDRGLECATCHGSMREHGLALLLAEEKAGQKIAEKDLAALAPTDAEKAFSPRLPWTQEPDCTACHDFSAKPRLESASAFNKWTDNSESAFARSQDLMGAVRCAACHGAPHATYPAANPLGKDRDNLPPLQYQGQASAMGASGNCAACHRQSMDFSAHHPLVERPSTLIHTPEGASHTLPVPSFAHDAHRNEACERCHHTGRVDGQSLLCVSSGCHDLPGQLPAGHDNGDFSPRWFRQAFHGAGKGSCLFCHQERRAQKLPAGPVECQGCHKGPSQAWATSHFNHP